MPRRVLEAVAPAKNIGLVFSTSRTSAPSSPGSRSSCLTPAGVMRLIEHAGVTLAGRLAVVIGRSNIVGKPLALLLLQKDATVTICHSKTWSCRADPGSRRPHCRVGRPKLVTAAMVKPGACVIDVGITASPTDAGRRRRFRRRQKRGGLDYAGARRRRTG